MQPVGNYPKRTNVQCTCLWHLLAIPLITDQNRENIMKKFVLLLSLITTTLILSPWITPAQAQATRTWVSGVGDDVNPCSRTAPCKTFAGAISKTAPRGEIDCLDPGGFGAVTITKAMTILCESASNGGVLVSGTSGVVVAAGA